MFIRRNETCSEPEGQLKYSHIKMFSMSALRVAASPDFAVQDSGNFLLAPCDARRNTNYAEKAMFISECFITLLCLSWLTNVRILRMRIWRARA